MVDRQRSDSNGELDANQHDVALSPLEPEAEKRQEENDWFVDETLQSQLGRQAKASRCHPAPDQRERQPCRNTAT